MVYITLPETPRADWGTFGFVVSKLELGLAVSNLGPQAGYALADTEQHTSAAIFRTMMSTCTGGVFWVRAGSTHKPGSDIGAFVRPLERQL